jgi:hypothetical protein
MLDHDSRDTFVVKSCSPAGGTSVRVGRLRDEGPLGPCVHEAQMLLALQLALPSFLQNTLIRFAMRIIVVLLYIMIFTIMMMMMMKMKIILLTTTIITV